MSKKERVHKCVKYVILNIVTNTTNLLMQTLDGVIKCYYVDYVSFVLVSTMSTLSYVLVKP